MRRRRAVERVVRGRVLSGHRSALLRRLRRPRRMRGRTAAAAAGRCSQRGSACRRGPAGGVFHSGLGGCDRACRGMCVRQPDACGLLTCSRGAARRRVARRGRPWHVR
eukprot:80645-Chlamydomonas_euryale.AAC.1